MTVRWIQQFMTMRIASCGLLFVASLAFAAATPDELYQEALIKQNGERDLSGAMTLYHQVLLDKSATPDLLAHVHLQLGFCDEQLGRLTEAESEFTNVVSLARVARKCSPRPSINFPSLR